MELKDKQIGFLIEKITKNGTFYGPLREELVDHLACLVEKKMSDNLSFDESLDLVWPNFKNTHLEESQSETNSLLTNKSNRMKNVFFSIAASLAASLFFAATYHLSFIPEEKDHTDIFIDVNQNDFEGKPVLVLNEDPPSRSPLNKSPKITSSFGMRFHPIYHVNKMHKGVDFKAKMGTPVYATADGIVEKVYTHDKYGKLIVLKHDKKFQTLYAQLSEFNVKKGQAIKKGDLIGKTGNSGLSTAPHLHYEVMEDGKAVNPEQFL